MSIAEVVGDPSATVAWYRIPYSDFDDGYAAAAYASLGYDSGGGGGGGVGGVGDCEHLFVWVPRFYRGVEVSLLLYI
jgi:hypothetical protein